MKRLLLFLTIFGASFIILEAQTITWTGAGNGINWSDPNNWDLTTIPTSSHDVIIPDGSTLTINVSTSVKSIAIQGVSTVTMSNTLSFFYESSFGINSVVNWSSGYLTGGGILTNKGTINLMTTDWKGIWMSTLNNEGTINIISNGKFIIDSILNNQAMGIIDLKGDGIQIGYAYGFGHTLNNYGTILKSEGSGVSQIMVWTINFGTIEVMMGEMEFTDNTFLAGLNNMDEGVIKGIATIDLPEFDPPAPGVEKFINSGTFSPGASPGTLTVIGDFTSNTSSQFAIELNGLNQGTDYDLLAIQGEAVFDGIVDITMGFEGNLNDEFIIATTTGTITQCTLASAATSIFNGQQYDFDVACRNNNEVVLTITNITVGKTVTWNGGGDGVNWSDVNNWNPSTVPTLADDVIIPDGSTLTIEVPAYVNSIEVQGTSTLSITNDLTFKEESLFGINSTINWSLGNLRSGDSGPNAHISLLTNRGTINAFDSGIYMYGIGLSYCKLINEGTINISDRFTLYIDGELNNEISGIIFMEEGAYLTPQIGVPGYFNAGLLNNSGIIKITNGNGINGIVGIYVPINNFGIIEVVSGILRIGSNGLNNSVDGIIKGTATIHLPGISYYTNEGTFSPGASPGTLTVIGDFTSSPSSKLAIEINGMNQGVDCDLLTIQGDAIFDGFLDVTMGFAGNINDEFIVVTTTGTITECSLTSTATSIFDGIQYNFDVACRNDNEVVLTIVDKALGVDTNELWNANISLFPNPTSHRIILRNESEHKLRSALIMDISGRILKSVDLNEMGRDKSISLRNYAIGHYFVRINSEEGSIVKRFIKL